MGNVSLLDRGLDALGLQLDATAKEKILSYCDELLKWNRRINLVARRTTADEALEKHFLDSLSLLPIMEKYGSSPGKSLLDVGTGAGFPGLVLAVAMPELTVTLVEPRQKRVAFLRHMVRILECANVEILAHRLEETDCDERTFTFITSRAVAEAGSFLDMLVPVARPGTRVIVMQGAREGAARPGEELQSGWRLEETRSFQLPFSGVARRLLVLRAVVSG
jgi:16S rRNA (guanine527-N7)-methyltransferase